MLWLRYVVRLVGAGFRQFFSKREKAMASFIVFAAQTGVVFLLLCLLQISGRLPDSISAADNLLLAILTACSLIISAVLQLLWFIVMAAPRIDARQRELISQAKAAMQTFADSELAEKEFFEQIEGVLQAELRKEDLEPYQAYFDAFVANYCDAEIGYQYRRALETGSWNAHIVPVLHSAIRAGRTSRFRSREALLKLHSSLRRLSAAEQRDLGIR